ncbi:hypothetical protein ACFIJ5_18615 (plasmid) [Haloimpatiens sp. FM7330]|uniref:hypothetical protein n=1 Tax=Haloimpatiens sp. FM7330 TaxID=3298610 RepID=UPI00362D7883
MFRKKIFTYQNNKLLLTIILFVCIVEMLIYANINYEKYAESLRHFENIYIIQSIIIIIFKTIIKHRNISIKSFLVVNIIFLIVFPMIVIINLPKYSYSQAKTIFMNKKVDNSVTILDENNPPSASFNAGLEDFKIVSLRNKSYFLCTDFYIFFVEDKNDKSIYGYVFNSYTGNINKWGN